MAELIVQKPEIRYEILKVECSCKQQIPFKPAPGQRALDKSRILEIADVIIKDVTYEIPLQPIYCMFDTKTMWIVDGQHRYAAFKNACEKGIHRRIYILYEIGSEKRASEAYKNQLLSVAHPETYKLTEEQRKLFQKCQDYIQNTYKDLTGVPSQNTRLNRPRFDYDKLIGAYFNVFRDVATIEHFQQTITSVNTKIRKSFDDGTLEDLKRKPLNEKNIEKATSKGVYFGLILSESFEDWFLENQ